MLTLDPPAMHQPDSPAPALAGLRVLVVDDNRDAADTLTLLLRAMGADARACHGGEEALALAEGLRPQAGVLDVHMPRMDGCELAGRLRGRFDAGLLLVAMTGVSDPAARERTADAGFDLHLTKADPLDPLLAALADRRAEG